MEKHESEAEKELFSIIEANMRDMDRMETEMKTLREKIRNSNGTARDEHVRAYAKIATEYVNADQAEQMLERAYRAEMSARD